MILFFSLIKIFDLLISNFVEARIKIDYWDSDYSINDDEFKYTLIPSSVIVTVDGSDRMDAVMYCNDFTICWNTISVLEDFTVLKRGKIKGDLLLMLDEKLYNNVLMNGDITIVYEHGYLNETDIFGTIKIQIFTDDKIKNHFLVMMGCLDVKLDEINKSVKIEGEMNLSKYMM
ncbi:hypothetical protein HERIO_148 [Hepatospora eriocheir]|uniref:Organic solvent tolerance-like N-terminal domain-containing protein n=1 Tax=Hepatospora eriocheir TaxID=1081669 RepID=A0A1X0QE58_9MICR|nr:hypothetical protein HERIO_148 [Hepatospora eriocheir]